MAARMTKVRGNVDVSNDWPPNLLVPIGLLLWAGGSVATLYHDLILQVDNSAASMQASYAQLGAWGASGLVFVAIYAGPLGIIILAYWWAVWRRKGGTLLILSVILAQFAIGWLVDTKEVAISALVVALLTRFIIVGNIPARWILGAFAAIALAFPILSAKRVIVTEELQLTRAQALPRTLDILLQTVREADAVKAGKYAQSSETFLERSSVKGSVNLIVEGTPVSHPYKYGATFEPVLYVFLPRIFWSDKPGGNSAQLFNREFHLSEDPDTFVSPSHLGEWYWNFGIAGAIVGMGIAGALLGYISVRFDPSAQTSVTRVLVIIVTLYELVLRTEGQIEIQYVLWARLLLLIGILHFILGRHPSHGTTSSSRNGRTPNKGNGETGRLRFPNLMR
jgi:hypothetical protein